MDEHQRHILVVDDDVRLRDLLAGFLRREGFAVTTVENVTGARKLMKGLRFDALVLDVMMPGESGLVLVKEFRQRRDAPPILLLSAQSELEHRIEGLETGADDYLPKPFDPRELVARLMAIIRRRPVINASEDMVTFGPYQYSVGMQKLRGLGSEMRLPDAEASVLAKLCLRLDDALTREELADGTISGRAVDVQIVRLRRKIENDPKMPRLLETVRGVGYKLRRFPIPVAP